MERVGAYKLLDRTSQDIPIRKDSSLLLKGDFVLEICVIFSLSGSEHERLEGAALSASLT